MSRTVYIDVDELEELLERAAEKGATRALAQLGREPPAPAPPRERKRRVASAEMHERIAKKNARYSGPGR